MAIIPKNQLQALIKEYKLKDEKLTSFAYMKSCQKIRIYNTNMLCSLDK